MPMEITEEMKKRMDEMNLPTIEEMLIMLIKEGALILVCPLAKELFRYKEEDFIEGIKVADPSTYYREIVMKLI